MLADYDLLKWSGTEALRLLRQEDQEIPFILVTSAVGEDVAVECIKMGATDYVLKDRPMRLPLAVKRAIQERLAIDERRQAEQTRDRLAAIVESSEDAIISLTPKGGIVKSELWSRANLWICRFRDPGYGDFQTVRIQQTS